MSRVWAHSRQKGGELLIMLALADFANDEGECWPSIPVLAQKARLTERQVQKLIPKLQEAGELLVERSNGGRNRRNRFFVTGSENGELSSPNKIHRKENGEFKDAETVNSGSPALNRHRTVSNSTSRKKRERADTDPTVKTLIAAFSDKYFAQVSTWPVITGKDAASLKRLLTGNHEPPEIEAAMDQYFADPFFRKIGFDAAGFAKAFNRLISAGAKKKHNYDQGLYPGL
jgi:hypothetical protein